MHNWFGSKSQHRFSSIHIDQALEQQNTVVKGKGGVIGLTENPVSLQRWLLCGPELARCISEFESDVNYKNEGSGSLGSRELLHHKECLATQKHFKQQVNSLVDTIDGFGNSFQDDCLELLILNTRACADTSVVETLQSVEALASGLYQQYKSKVLTNRKASIHNSIKMNFLALFRLPRPKPKS